MTNQNRYPSFFEDIKEWTKQPVTVFANAAAKSYKEYQKNPKKTETKDAAIMYQSRLEACEFLAGKFFTFHEGKNFHDFPDGFLKEIKYEKD